MTALRVVSRSRAYGAVYYAVITIAPSHEAALSQALAILQTTRRAQ